jgi:6-phosphofructokinase 1
MTEPTEFELDPRSLAVRNLGPRLIDSPLDRHLTPANPNHKFYSDDHRVLVRHYLPDIQEMIEMGKEFPCFEVAGPRRKIFFDPSKTTCAIVTCGGLCPGLNDVIRAIVIQACYRYSVKRVLGIQYGLEGLNPKYGHQPVILSPDGVHNIHKFGGTSLGTSRGPQDVKIMVDRLQQLGVQILFVIGGDGSQRAALAIDEEAKRRGLLLSVVGVPKTIDNDMIYLDKSFGFETAVAAAVNAVHAAHTEARSARNGVGLVKLMGRHSGFITCYAALASGEVNFALIPEVPFRLDGENGFLECLFRRVKARGHAVIVVAEGAGQEHLGVSGETDASGNLKLGNIGHFLRDRITEFFQEKGEDLTLKYIDPSYMIRSVPASTQDRIYCQRLGQAAVHAAMAGKTGIVVGRWHGVYVHIPIAIATSRRRTVDPRTDLWLSVLEATGQPARFY